VLALLERAAARQHGARHEEPSVPAIEEHPECRDHLNSSRDRHKVEVITRHGVPVVCASRSPRRIVKGSAERGPGGQAESPASRVVPLDGPVIPILSSNANSPVWRTFRRDVWGNRERRGLNGRIPYAFLLRVPAKHLDGHGLARHEYSSRRRHAVGRNEDVAVSNIEKNPSDASDRDEVVLVGHRMSAVRTIRDLASDTYSQWAPRLAGLQRGRYAAV